MTELERRLTDALKADGPGVDEEILSSKLDELRQESFLGLSESNRWLFAVCTHPYTQGQVIWSAIRIIQNMEKQA